MKLVIYFDFFSSTLRYFKRALMFDVTRYKYCDADSGGRCCKNTQYLKINILLDLDRLIDVSDICA